MEEERRTRPSLAAVVKTIMWSFLGIRRREEHESEAVQLSPLQIVAAGVIGAAILVLILVALVRFIVSGAG